MPAGRPTLYNDKIADLICGRISTHPCGITKLCKMYDDMPDASTIFDWRHKYPEFSLQYANAKIKQIEVFVDEIIDIADNITQDEIVNHNGVTVCNSEFIARSRLRVDARKWLASKLVPKLYGERQLVDIESTAFSQEVKDKMASLSKLPNEHEKEY